MACTTGMFLGGSPASGRHYPCPLSGYSLRSVCMCVCVSRDLGGVQDEEGSLLIWLGSDFTQPACVIDASICAEVCCICMGIYPMGSGALWRRWTPASQSLCLQLSLRKLKSTTNTPTTRHRRIISVIFTLSNHDAFHKLCIVCNILCPTQKTAFPHHPTDIHHQYLHSFNCPLTVNQQLA